MKAIQKLLCIAMVVLVTSCKKQSDEDTSFPTLLLQLPVVNQVSAAGDIVNIAISVTDNSLHELTINIINSASHAILNNKVISVHALTSYTINESWVNNV
jgi:hypothetical protein